MQLFKKVKQSASKPQLFDKDMQMKIDRYRGNIDDFLQNTKAYEAYLAGRDPDYDFDFFSDIEVEGLIPGNCTAEGTQRFVEKAVGLGIPKRNFRKPIIPPLEAAPLQLSTVGLGTYLGPTDDATDFDVYNAAKLLVNSGGVNVIDTAINYRC